MRRPPDTAQVSKKIPTVVVVDHSDAAISHYRASARGLDIEMKAFNSADEAVAHLNGTRPSLVFLDLLMPERDGLAILREIRALPGQGDTPIVVVTSKDYAQDRASARELGAIEFCLKPLRSREVRALIARYAGITAQATPDDGGS
jgi:CheY-like chemotaxis protein